MTQKEELVEEFYAAFATNNAATMQSCYHKDIQFEDPIFGILKGTDVGDMWQMLLEKGKGNIKIEFSDITERNHSVTATWVATYTFSRTNRVVVNKIRATFEFKENLIFRHTDNFDIWKWSQQALGLKGFLLGWTGLMQQKMQQTAVQTLRKYQLQSK